MLSSTVRGTNSRPSDLGAVSSRIRKRWSPKCRFDRVKRATTPSDQVIRSSSNMCAGDRAHHHHPLQMMSTRGNCQVVFQGNLRWKLRHHDLVPDRRAARKAALVTCIRHSQAPLGSPPRMRLMRDRFHFGQRDAVFVPVLKRRDHRCRCAVTYRRGSSACRCAGSVSSNSAAALSSVSTASFSRCAKPFSSALICFFSAASFFPCLDLGLVHRAALHLNRVGLHPLHRLRPCRVAALIWLSSSAFAGIEPGHGLHKVGHQNFTSLWSSGLSFCFARRPWRSGCWCARHQPRLWAPRAIRVMNSYLVHPPRSPPRCPAPEAAQEAHRLQRDAEAVQQLVAQARRGWRVPARPAMRAVGLPPGLKGIAHGLLFGHQAGLPSIGRLEAWRVVSQRGGSQSSWHRARRTMAWGQTLRGNSAALACTSAFGHAAQQVARIVRLGRGVVRHSGGC